MKGPAPDARKDRRGTSKRAPAGSAKPPATVPALPQVVELAPPECLPPAGAQAWRLAVAEMSANRQLRESDLILVRAYAEAVQTHEDASAAIHRDGVMVAGAMGQPIANPMVRVQKDAAATIRQLSDVLGLNPLSRIRTGIMELAGQSMLMEIRERLVKDITKG